MPRPPRELRSGVEIIVFCKIVVVSFVFDRFWEQVGQELARRPMMRAGVQVEQGMTRPPRKLRSGVEIIDFPLVFHWLLQTRCKSIGF